jgi:hypothetical protein
MTNDVANLVKQAAEAAKHVPEHLQEAAFNKAFEALLAGTHGTQDRVAQHKGGARKPAKKKDHKPTVTVDRDHLDQLDRTAHPEITHSDTSLNNSLRLLRAAKDDLDIDGLTATSIARTLVDKFRCRITQQAVSKALNNAGRHVNRHKDGKLVVFRIMAPGEEYLEKLSAGQAPDAKTQPRRQTSKKKGADKAKEPEKARGSTGTKPAAKKTSTKRKTGPASALDQLYNGGFFSSARTIADITSKLRHDFGRTFKQSELSPVLLRWLRSGKLTRKHNSDNQYEYTQA